MVDHETTAFDEEHERTMGLLLLGKGAVIAHVFSRPPAAESDETEQPGSDAASSEPRYRNAR
jgi:hypothetical protein